MSDLLWRHLRDLPAFRALLRAVEAHFYDELSLSHPILDLGCGDGHFASVAFDEPLAVGLDPGWPPLREALRRGGHRTLTRAVGGRMPFPDEHFATVVSNSVLEHILDVQAVLDEVTRVLRPGGWLYFCVPGPNFLRFLSVSRGLDRLGCGRAADAYRHLFNRISRHHHCDGVSMWRDRLEAAGLDLEDSWVYFSRRALTALEWGHYLGLPSLIAKKLTGRWVLWPSRVNLWLTYRLVRPLYEGSASRPVAERGHGFEGAYLFFVARRRSLGRHGEAKRLG